MCVLFAIMSYFYKYVDPNLLSPSFTADLRIHQNDPKDGKETRSLMGEKDSPPPYYSSDVADSDVDTAPLPTYTQDSYKSDP